VRRILIADDHDVVRRGIRQLLREALPDVHLGEVASAADALQALEREKWDLLLLDLNMPGRGGLDMLADAKRRDPGMAVLVLSAYPEEDFAVRCIRLGAAGFVSKASASDALVFATRRALAGGRYITPSLAEKLASVVGGEDAHAPHEALSDRELEVLRLVAHGKTLKEIASQFHLSEKTIATYRTRISVKLGLSTKVELTRYALKHGLVD
jgi:DNA-binding NarL/FixJ family response regulator